MERNLERKTVSFGKGMTNVPGDLLSEDGELAFSEGFICKDGEMKVIQEMSEIDVIPVSEKIVYMHKGADYSNLITWSGEKLFWYIYDGGIKTPEETNEILDISGFELFDIKHIGNTLVCATSDGLYYLLFKNGKYIDLGNDIPDPEFVPYMQDYPDDDFSPSVTVSLSEIITKKTLTGYTSKETGEFLGFYDGMIFTHPSNLETTEVCKGEGFFPVTKDKIIDYLNAVQGSVLKCINYARERNCFCFPFFIRYALRLYDGTYTKISAPIICYPTISRNYKGFIDDSNNVLTSKVYYAKLQYTAKIPQIEYWKDIVKELVVFATKEVIPYKNVSSTDYKDWECAPNGVPEEYLEDEANYLSGKSIFSGHILAKYKKDKEIIDELVNKSQFYKLASLQVSDSSDFPNKYKELPIKSSVVSTLEEQEQLKVDDYFSWTTKKCKNIFLYNNRINVFDYERNPYNGFNTFNPVNIVHDSGRNFDTDLEYIKYHVHIVSDRMDRWVVSEKREFNCVGSKIGGEKMGSVGRLFDDWFYYPDPNAIEAYVEYKSSKRPGPSYIYLSLKIHPMLNGAYSFNYLPRRTAEEFYHDDFGQPKPVIYDGGERFDSSILTSVVNNPFVFEASGDNTVGTGKILGIVANTDAVSQGQFGQYPLLVFTDEGIYAMSVNSEGLYSSIHPISREVCNNAESITPTDKLIFFTSEKGLMATSGGEAVCVSGALSGSKNRGVPENILPFRKYLENCMIAYDYKASLLRIFNKREGYHYVYNMADKNFSVAANTIYDDAPCKSVVNNYPDNLVQLDNNTIYSLTRTPLEEDDENKYDGTIVTRPLKLGGSIVLKSLREIKHLFDSDTGTIKVELYGSNNCKDWVRLNSVGGKPWKYFKLKYNLKNFKASDTFDGSIIEVQSRREDKIR